MIVDTCMRWREKCATFVSPRHRFDPTRYEFAEIDGVGADTVASGFVELHHYSGSYPNAWRRFGLYERGELVGVAVYSVPTRMESLAPFALNAACDLGRLVLLDRVPFNAETWLVTRCANVLRGLGVDGFVMFSDPFARTTEDGRVVHVGHRGIIYQGLGACFLGQRKGESLYLLPDGRSFPRRELAKIVARDRGWVYAAQTLVEAGARPPWHTGTAAALQAWVSSELPRVARKVKHPGNLKYAFPLSPRGRAMLPASQPYVKLPKPVCAPFHGRAAA